MVPVQESSNESTIDLQKRDPEEDGYLLREEQRRQQERDRRRREADNDRRNIWPYRAWNSMPTTPCRWCR